MKYGGLVGKLHFKKYREENFMLPREKHQEMSCPDPDTNYPRQCFLLRRVWILFHMLYKIFAPITNG